MVGTHGVLPEEKTRAQPFEIDLDLAVDLAPASAERPPGRHGRLRGRGRAGRRSWWPDRSFELLEALAGAVAEAALASDPRITTVTVHLRKLRPPLAAGPRHRRGADHPAPVTAPAAELPTVRAFLGLGSNLGDRWSHLRRAVDQLRAGSRAPVTAVSRVYETEPVGGPEGQGPYLNVVVELAVYPAGRSLPAARGVPPPGGGRRSGPGRPVGPADPRRRRAVDRRSGRSTTPDLTVPHPRWRERRFVLAPLAELAPDLVDEDDLAAAGGEVAVVGTL